MERPYQYITVERHGDVYYVRLGIRRLGEMDIVEMADEVVSLIIDEGCRKLAFSLGPEPPQCMYSVFLAKLIYIRRRLKECGGCMKLCEAAPDVVHLFEACHLQDFFDFLPDRQSAIAALEASSDGRG
jgi:hypothetical protein